MRLYIYKRELRVVRSPDGGSDCSSSGGGSGSGGGGGDDDNTSLYAMRATYLRVLCNADALPE